MYILLSERSNVYPDVHVTFPTTRLIYSHEDGGVGRKPGLGGDKMKGARTTETTEKTPTLNKDGTVRKTPVRAHIEDVMRYASYPEVQALLTFLRSLKTDSERASVIRIAETTIP